MLYDYVISERAYEDIDKSLEYISKTLANPKAANDLYTKIKAEIHNCRYYPYSYPDCSHYFIGNTAYRHIPIKNYILIFRVNDLDHKIEILRFILNSRS